MLLPVQSARSFDVICAGGPRWVAANSHVSLASDPRLAGLKLAGWSYRGIAVTVAARRP